MDFEKLDKYRVATINYEPVNWYETLCNTAL